MAGGQAPLPRCPDASPAARLQNGRGTKRVSEAADYANPALWEREEILELAERSAGIGVWDIDMATGTLQGRPQLFALMGLPPTPGPVSIDTLRALRHPEDRDRV